jgi:hypothetical protein
MGRLEEHMTDILTARTAYDERVDLEPIPAARPTVAVR